MLGVETLLLQITEQILDYLNRVAAGDNPVRSEIICDYKVSTGKCVYTACFLQTTEAKFATFSRFCVRGLWETSRMKIPEGYT